MSTKSGILAGAKEATGLSTSREEPAESVSAPDAKLGVVSSSEQVESSSDNGAVEAVERRTLSTSGACSKDDRSTTEKMGTDFMVQEQTVAMESGGSGGGRGKGR